jgi:hypothetical protein
MIIFLQYFFAFNSASVGKKYSILIVYVINDLTKLEVNREISLKTKMIHIYYRNQIFEYTCVGMRYGPKIVA